MQVILLWHACLYSNTPKTNSAFSLFMQFARNINFVLFFCFVFLPLSSSYPVEGGGLQAKAKKRSSISNGSIKKVEARKALSLEAAQLEIQQQHKTLTRQVAIR